MAAAPPPAAELMAEHGDQFLKALKAKAAKLNGAPTKTLESKIDVLRRMVEFSRTVPDDWSEYDRLANTPKGRGIHAMNLDIDIGPLLQTNKLMNSVIFARQNGFKGTPSAAELEMMNLMGDGDERKDGQGSKIAGRQGSCGRVPIGQPARASFAFCPLLNCMSWTSEPVSVNNQMIPHGDLRAFVLCRIFESQGIDQLIIHETRGLRKRWQRRRLDLRCVDLASCAAATIA